jgi:type III secretion system low calcium response chaperone LcrH/SycD
MMETRNENPVNAQSLAADATAVDTPATAAQIKEAQDVIDAVLSGATLKDLHGFSDETMEGMYAHAHRFYTQGRLEEAEVFFRFLCIYDFYNPEYALGLAAVHQLKKDYRRAIDLYALAYALSHNDHRAMFYAGQCHLMLGSRGKARECFNIVVEKSGDEKLCHAARGYLAAVERAANAGVQDSRPAQPTEGEEDGYQ